MNKQVRMVLSYITALLSNKEESTIGWYYSQHRLISEILYCGAEARLKGTHCVISFM